MNHSPRAFTTRLFNHKPFRNMLVVLIAIALCIALIVTVIESGAPKARITTLEEGLWWAVTTITGVGYGDFVPVTTLGRVFGAILEVAGVLIFGLIIGIIGITLSKRQEEYLWFRLFDRLDQLEMKLSQQEKQIGNVIDQFSYQERIRKEQEREAQARIEQERRQREMERFREQEKRAQEELNRSKRNMYDFSQSDPFADFSNFPMPKPQQSFPKPTFPKPLPQTLPSVLQQPRQQSQQPQPHVSQSQFPQQSTTKPTNEDEVTKLLDELLKNDKQSTTNQHTNTNQPGW